VGIINSIASWFTSGGDDGGISSVRFGRKSVAGPVATPTTSLQLSAYYACTRNISEDVGKLPVKILDTKKDGRKVVPTGSPLIKLFVEKPNPQMTVMTMKEVVTSHALGWGNGYMEIVRDTIGRPVELWPIHPSRVIVKCDPETKDIYYEVYQSTLNCGGETVRIESEDMFHLKGLGGDGIVGYSVCKFAAESLGTALATQEFGGAFFGNGSQLGGYLEHPNQMSKEAQDRLKQSLDENHRGSRNAYKTAVLEEGMKWHAATIPPKDAQFIEIKNFQVVDVARWFRMPPHKIQDLSRATFSNIEEQNIDYVNDTLTPWLTRWEEEIKAKLIKIPNRYARFQVQELLRGDQKGRSEFYKGLFNLGALSPNDIRGFEDLDPITDPAADQYYMQTSMATIQSIAAPKEEDMPAEEPQEEPVEQVEQNEDEAIQEEEAEAISPMPLIQDAVARVNTKERKALSRGKPLSAKFYEKQRDYLIESIEPIFKTFRIESKLPKICIFADEHYNSRIESEDKSVEDAYFIDYIEILLNA